MPVKLLFLTLRTFSFTGGIEKVCRSMSRVLYDLSEEGIIKSAVYSMYDKNDDRDSRYLSKNQFIGYNGNRKYFVLKSIITGLNSDVIILSHIHLLNVGYMIKKLSPKKKVFLIAHGIEIWKKLPESKLNILKSLDKIIAVSHFTAEKIVQMHQVHPDQIMVLNNCLDPFYAITKTFGKPEKLLNRYQLRSENTILFSLSRLCSSEKYKGYDHTIEVLPALLKKHPKLVYLLGGKWEDAEKIRLELLIKKYNLENQVKLIGFVDEAEVINHFLLSDIFVMPSKKEGFGIVFIEAVASGLSVIAGNKDGSVDALKNGILGMLADPDDLEDLKKKIDFLLDHPQNTADKLKLQQLCLQAFNFSDYKNTVKNLLLN